MLTKKQIKATAKQQAKELKKSRKAILLDTEARGLVEKMAKLSSEQLGIYRDMAQREGLGLQVVDEFFADVEFDVTLTANQILKLMEVRKFMGHEKNHEESLSQTINRLVDTYLAESL